MSTPARSVWLTLLRQVVFRHWQKTPGQTALIVLLLAVGVAVFLSVRVANRAAVASFGHFTEVLTGSSDWVVTAPAGTLPEAALVEMRQALGAEPVHLLPLIEVVAAAPRQPGKDWGGGAYTLLGLDLFAAANLDPQVAGSTLPWRNLGEGEKLWATAATLAREGQQLSLVLADQVRSVSLTGPIPSAAGQPAPPERLLIGDLSLVQRWVHREGTIDRVEVILEKGPDATERRTRVRERLLDAGQGRWVIEAPGARQESAATMTEAFRLNLTILSLIALLVGLYLIGQTLEGAVVRRRAEIATLKALGVSPGWIRGLWLMEAGLLGLAGSALGLTLGWAGAQVTVRMVGQTVNALYYTTSVAEANLTVSEAAFALVAGTAACLAAAFGPARVAAATPPAQLLAQHRLGGLTPPSKRSGRLGVWLLLAGGLLALLPGVPLAGGSAFPLAGHLAAFAWIAGAGLLAGPLLATLASYLRGRFAAQAPATLALGYLAFPTRRHRIAIAGLVCATAMTAGMMVLVGSFEASVRGWIQQALRADLFISSQGAQSASAQSRLSAETVERLSTWPGVTQAYPHWLERIRWRGLPTQLHGADLAALAATESMLWLTRPREVQTAGVEAAWASETFLNRFGARLGDVLTVPTATGELKVEIVATFSDYGNEHGALWLDFNVLRRALRETGATSLALMTRSDVSIDSLQMELRAALPALSVYSNATLRTEILRIFHQTFSLTYALEVIGLVVALTGLALTLISMGLERRDDLTTLRALGFTRAELATISRTEAALLAGVAGMVGAALSVALGGLLVYVINRQSFGWTLQFTLPWTWLVGLVILLTACGALVGHGVGRWSAALPADQEVDA